MRSALVLFAATALAAGCSPKPQSPPAAASTPTAAAPAPQANAGDTTIGVGPDGTYTINGQPTHAKTLQEALEEAARRDAAAAKAGGAK